MISFARFCSPRAGQRARPHSSKAEGLRLEQRIAAVLPGAERGRWVKYSDGREVHYCQFDFLLRIEETTVIVECKRVYHSYVLRQLRTYLAVAQKIFGGKVVAVVVTSAEGLTFEGLRAAVEKAIEADVDITYWKT